MPGNVCYAPMSIGETLAAVLANPPAGTNNPNWIWTVPVNQIWLVEGLHYVLVTSAVVATRFWLITTQDAGLVTIWRSGGTATTQQTAGQTRRYIHAINNGDIERVGYDTTGALECFHLPLGKFLLNPGDRLLAFFVGFDNTPITGDQFSQIRLHGRKWRT